MLGKQLVQAKQTLTKSAYGDLQQKDYMSIIDEKDQIIRKLEFKVEKMEKDRDQLMKVNSVGANSFYKQKLEQEIKDNQAATEMLINLGTRMQKLADLLRLNPEKCEDSTEVKNILKLMGDGNQEEQFDLDDSEMENMDAVQSEVIKKLQDLEAVCDSYHKNYNKTLKEYTTTEMKLKQLSKQNKQQILTLQNQIKQLHKQKQHYKLLHQKTEQQKKQLIKNITNCMEQKQRKQIEGMSRQQLVEYIKKLFYKINELEVTKIEVIKQNKKIKTADLEKYKKILSQVKEVKEMSRLGQSMM